MRIDQTDASMAPRSLNEQLNRVAQFEEALAQLARLHWAKWDMRWKQLGLARDFWTRSPFDDDGDQQGAVAHVAREAWVCRAEAAGGLRTTLWPCGFPWG